MTTPIWPTTLGGHRPTTYHVADYVRRRTGTSSISLNRIVASVDPRLNLHSNCTEQMISRATYEEFLLPYDCWLAERLQPYGIHHSRLRTQPPDEVRADVERLLNQAGPLDKLALCCVSMDAGTSDQNVQAILEAAESCRHRAG